MNEYHPEQARTHLPGSSPARPRLYYLDSLRGLAALSVVVYHLILHLLETGALHGTGRMLAEQVQSTFDIGKFGVVLFFLISGYIIPSSLGPSDDRIGIFCIKRFFRLYPLYWLVLFFGIFLTWPDLNQKFTPVTILSNVTMIQGFLGQQNVVGAFWTLQIELTFYACCVCLAFLRLNNSARTYAIACVFFLVLAVLTAIARNLFVLKLPLSLPLALSVMFAGTLWREATLSRIAQARRLIAWILPSLTATIFPISIIGYNHDFGFHERWQSYVICYISAIVVFILGTAKLPTHKLLAGRLLSRGSPFRSGRIRPLIWLGEISYSIYLVHPLVASAVERMGLTSANLPLDPLLYMVLLTIFIILCAAITYNLIERPAVRLGHRLVSLRRPLRDNLPPHQEIDGHMPAFWSSQPFISEHLD